MGVVLEQQEVIKAGTVKVIASNGEPAFGIYASPPSVWPPVTTNTKHLLIPASLLSSPDAKTIEIEAFGKKYIADVIAVDPSGRIAHCHMPGIQQAKPFEYPPIPSPGKGSPISNMPVCFPPDDGEKNWAKATISTIDSDDHALIAVDTPRKLPLGTVITNNIGSQLVGIVIGSQKVVIAIGSQKIDGQEKPIAIRPQLAQLPPPPPKKHVGPMPGLGEYRAYPKFTEYQGADPNYKPPTINVMNAGPIGNGADGKPIYSNKVND